jgi:membrane-associated protease RseP (regulator of RpoE activity)
VRVKILPLFAAFALIPAALVARAQTPAPPPPAAPTRPAPTAQAAPLAPPQEPEPPAAPHGYATTFFTTGNFLGVRTEEVTRGNASRYNLSGEPRGVGVREVVKGSPAEKAGFKAGDVILRFDGEPVTSVRKLTRLVEEAAPEHAARLTVLRSGSEQELSATLTRREPFVSASGDGAFFISPDAFGDAMRLGEEMTKNSEPWKRNEEQMRRQLGEMGREHPGLFGQLGSSRRIGVTTQPLGKQLADYFGVAHGVLVASVEANGPADKAGLKAGDVVTEADGKQIEDVEDLAGALSAKEEGEVTLTVVRDRKQRTVRVTPERRPLPQGVLSPGLFRVLDSPVAAMSLPQIEVTPLTPVTPRVRITPRFRLLGPQDRIL